MPAPVAPVLAAATTAGDMPSATPAPPPAAKPASAPAPEPATSAATTPAPLRIDPLLGELAAGNARAVADKMPQVIGRLLPVLRLLGPGQRAQLIQLLQRLG